MASSVAREWFMRTRSTTIPAVLLTLCAAHGWAQVPATDTRASVVSQAQAAKSAELHPYVRGKAEAYLDRAETILTTGARLHPYFESAYSGGGFTLGAGYRT